MAYKQLVIPNLDPYIYQPDGKGGTYLLTSWSGWCLAYVQTAFGAGWAGATAWISWSEKTTFKHADRNLPDDVYVPIWFSGYYGYGHTAIYYRDSATGVVSISTSPLAEKPFADTYPSISALENDYGVTYVGWSEDIGGLQVVAQKAEATPTLEPFQRLVVNTDGINGRTQPTTQAPVVKEFARGDILDFEYAVKGEDPYGNGQFYWGKGKYSETYWWLGATNDPSPAGLKVVEGNVSVTPTPTPPQAPTTPTTPTPTAYSFTKDLPCVTEVDPAGEGNFELGNFPAKPEKVVLHDFGTKARDTVTSVLNSFNKDGYEVSSHFVVSGKRIIQMVSLHDRAYHAGPNGNNFVGVEIDPAMDANTVESVKQLRRDLDNYYGYKLAPIEHNQIMATACGDDVVLEDLDPYTVETPVEIPEPNETGDTPVIVSPTPAPSEPSIVTLTSTVLVNMVVTFFQTFLATWGATGFNTDKLALAGAIGGALSLVWNTILKPFLISRGILKQ